MTRFQFAIIGVAGVLLGTVVSTAQTTGPVSAPVAAAPTSQPVDQTTPQGTLKVFTRAARDGNGQAIRSVLFPESEQEQAVADIVSNRVVAAVKLQKAATRFPGQDTDPAELDKAMASAFNDIDLAEVKIDGETATVTTLSREPGVPGSAIPFKKKNGQWGMVMTGMMTPLAGNPAEFAQRIARAKIETDAISELATEITDGKYNNMDEAGRTLQTRVQAGIMKLQTEAMQASTQPGTTQPTTSPAGK